MTKNESLTATSGFHGKTALVTGSTSGIGEAIARALATEGVWVLVSGRDASRGSSVVEDIRRAGGQADFLAVDLAGTFGEIRRFAADATAALGGSIDILVNNAGIYPATLTEDLADPDLDAMLGVNIRAPHILVGAIAPTMAARGTGTVINIGSWMARTGSPFAAMYSATKAAVEQLTRSWAAEYGPRGVRVNAVAPGATLTPGNESSRPVLDAMTAATPAGVVIQPHDISAGVVFLASNGAGRIHGITLDIDGDMSATRPL